MTMIAKAKKLLRSLSEESDSAAHLKLPLGKAAENQAREYLERQGLTFLSQNFHSKYGEIDLIMEDDEVLVFVEVRFRKNTHFGSPLESVTPAKQNKIRVTAQHYLQQNRLGEAQAIRFDVVGMTRGDTQWIKHAF